MGNSVRSTLGNMCGGQASKDIDADHEQRPVEKPKKAKKEKKNKKKNKTKNGALGEIPEEKEPEKPADETGENVKQEDTNAINAGEEGEKSKELEKSSESTEKVLTLKEKASETNLSILADPQHQNEDDDNVSDVIENGSDASSEHMQVENEQNDTIGTPNSRKGTFSSDISCDSRDGKSGSLNEPDFEQKFDSIHRVEELKQETLSIVYADQIFEKAANMYQAFTEKNTDFKTAVLDFEKSVDPGKTRPDFERCWKMYTELLDTENVRPSESSERTTSKSEVDVCDVNVNLQAIRGTGTTLLYTIREVRPTFENCVTEAGNVDVIEYVKGKMIEGEQLGITSKFSAPGKYRRNMKQLRNGLRLIDNVETDTKDILKYVESRLGSVSSKDLVDDEISIEPISKIDDDTDDDIFAKLGDDIPSDDELPSTDGTKTPSENMSTKSNPDETLLEKSGSLKERSASPTSVDQTYFIQTIPEFYKPTANHGNTSPLTKEVLAPLPKTQITQVTVEEEEHNTLDFGKYIFIDPSTGDIQVMRNRSRSLDSLVSMQSNRSSLSRFGSFEFVTDFEINIAEKNQQNMVKL